MFDSTSTRPIAEVKQRVVTLFSLLSKNIINKFIQSFKKSIFNVSKILGLNLCFIQLSLQTSSKNPSQFH